MARKRRWSRSGPPHLVFAMFTVLAALALLPSFAAAQEIRLGGEFRINTFTLFAQEYPAVAMNGVSAARSKEASAAVAGPLGQAAPTQNGVTTWRECGFGWLMDPEGNKVELWQPKG